MPPTARRPAAPPADPDLEVAARAPSRPTFGHREDWGKVRDFDLEYFDPAVQEAQVETFTAFVDPGAGPTLTYMRASAQARTNPQASAGAAAGLIFRAVVDYDGLPAGYEPPRSPTGDLLPDHEDYDERFEDRDAWSSRRRFNDVIDSEDLLVDGGVLEEIARWIAEAAIARPTGPPSASLRGAKRTRGGSARRR